MSLKYWLLTNKGKLWLFAIKFGIFLVYKRISLSVIVKVIAPFFLIENLRDTQEGNKNFHKNNNGDYFDIFLPTYVLHNIFFNMCVSFPVCVPFTLQCEYLKMSLNGFQNNVLIANL